MTDYIHNPKRPCLYTSERIVEDEIDDQYDSDTETFNILGELNSMRSEVNIPERVKNEVLRSLSSPKLQQNFCGFNCKNCFSPKAFFMFFTSSEIGEMHYQAPFSNCETNPSKIKYIFCPCNFGKVETYEGSLEKIRVVFVSNSLALDVLWNEFKLYPKFRPRNIVFGDRNFSFSFDEDIFNLLENNKSNSHRAISDEFFDNNNHTFFPHNGFF